MSSHFTVIKNDPHSSGRLGRLRTAHGEVQTPCFMPVGTQGTVKAMLPRDLEEIGCQMLLGNTYHLFLRPGHELIRQVGGLHRFMGWSGPILTDSGGFQVFSLAKTRKISEEGVNFQSHLDGSTELLTPETAVAIQEALGSDVAMVLDECIPHDADRQYVKASTERTIRWAERCVTARSKSDQLMFGIIQGGLFENLRRSCVEALSGMAFDGFAVGGLGVGEGEAQLRAIGSLTATLLPEERPRYLMGVGRPQDMVHAVRAGYDLFDCVIPTRNARNGWLDSDNGNGYCTTLIPINYDTCDETASDPCHTPFTWNTAIGFKSAHPGGANFLVGDGSVTFLPETIDHQLYQYLGGKQDGQIATWIN